MADEVGEEQEEKEEEEQREEKEESRRLPRSRWRAGLQYAIMEEEN